MNSADNPSPRLLGDTSWHDRAACRTTVHDQDDPDLFFPAPDEMDRIRMAKVLCAQCPVRSTCLDAALENGDQDGIRGGMTEEERHPLHRKFQHRLDYARVNAVLAGSDIHLTTAERRAVARAAYQAGTPAEELARLLKVTKAHAQKLYCRTRRQIRNRAVDRHEKTDTGEQFPGSRTTTLAKPSAKAPSHDDLGKAA
ncbi:WhiB family transcriptional regulator [Streptomyces sp. NPDC093707]|uniref:WhiB family transcriptional regulator n=1 Tax=Streptomyces sp. NPDC093707 TaxID=3154984 RepID=UPI00344B1203